MCSLSEHHARMAIPGTRTWLMADRLAGYKLAAHIVSLRADGSSWELIAQQLTAEFGVSVTAPTVQSWHRQITADEEQERSSTDKSRAPAPSTLARTEAREPDPTITTELGGSQ